MINVLFQANCSFQCLEKTVNVHPILLTKQPMAAYAKKPTLTQLNLPQEIVTKITTKELKQKPINTEAPVHGSRMQS